jgi:hypothetical protein
MWLATTIGFYSVAAHREKKGVYVVHARTRKDAENVAKMFNVPVEENKEADYRFRVYLNRKQLDTLMNSLIEGIDYSDFKSRVKKDPEQCKKMDVYHKIWLLFSEFQEEEARKY